MLQVHLEYIETVCICFSIWLHPSTNHRIWSTTLFKHKRNTLLIKFKPTWYLFFCLNICWEINSQVLEMQPEIPMYLESSFFVHLYFHYGRFDLTSIKSFFWSDEDNILCQFDKVKQLKIVRHKTRHFLNNLFFGLEWLRMSYMTKSHWKKQK